MKTTNANVTKQETQAALVIVLAVTEAIREAGELPEGHLYATLMGKMDLPAFEKMVRMIVGTGLIEKRGHLLCWVGPEVN